MSIEKSLEHIGFTRTSKTVHGVPLGKHYSMDEQETFVLSVSDRLRLFKKQENGSYTPIFIQVFGDIIPATQII